MKPITNPYQSQSERVLIGLCIGLALGLKGECGDEGSKGAEKKTCRGHSDKSSNQN